ncbi:predicted protein [Uncinocarpus reesii 1704]|uniref:Pentatricopeptide repeat protein n=1 Tax=Uncinocarpus reesii (strain UAMH 1704) TaxID=336963 RepID=C4JN33_UNCRE|nr:uncharacterized protein UREG_04241 [Uncinocarpus reesii 1704]EEP79395.1 predicted protein [Uncinocarpus reesii 1704]
MARLSWDCLPLYLQIFLVTTAFSATCYFPDGSEAKRDVPCKSNGATFCCRYNDICMSNGICMGVGDQPYVMSRGTCTDREWKAEGCPSVCRGPKDNADGGVAITVFRGGKHPTYCCGGITTKGDTKVCDNEDLPFSLQDGEMIFGHAALSNVVSSASATETDTTPTTPPAISPPSNSPSSGSCSSKSREVAIGAGVGVPLGIIALFAIGGMIFERRKRKAYIAQGQTAYGQAQWSQHPPETKPHNPGFVQYAPAELGGGEPLEHRLSDNTTDYIIRIEGKKISRERTSIECNSAKRVDSGLVHPGVPAIVSSYPEICTVEPLLQPQFMTMIPPPATGTALPSRGALRVLRRLALAGSTVGAIGGACTVATISYEVNRRVQLVENLVENKRSLKTTCPNYDSAARGAMVAKMMEAAEAGEFLGIDSMRQKQEGEVKQNAEDGRTLSGPAGKGPSEPKTTDPNAFRRRLEALTWMQSLHGPWNIRQPALRPSTRKYNRNADDTNLTNLLTELQSKDDGAVDSTPPLPSYRLRYRDSQEENAALAEKLLLQGKPIEASQRFLRAYPTATPTLPEEARQLCIKLFEDNLRADNVHLAYRLFRWMGFASIISQQAWESLILGLAKKWNLEMMATIYTDHADRFKLPKSLRYSVLRSLTDSFRLEEAKNMVFRFLKEDEQCSLSAVYLGRLWKKSRNVELVKAQFDAIVAELQDNEMPVSRVLYNALLEAYVESGQDELADDLVDRMKSKYNYSLPIRTLGLLAYGRALKSDWEGVERLFDEIQKTEPQHNSKWFAKIFDRVFLEYFLGNSASNIRNFLFHAIEKYNLVPDNVLFEHIIQAYIQKGDPTMMIELIEVAQAKAWPIVMKRGRFLDLLRLQRAKCGKANVGLWQMFRRFGRFSVSQRILGFNKNDFSENGILKLPRKEEPSIWSRKPDAQRDFHQFPALYQQMIHCMHVGSMDKAIELFKEAKMLGKVMRELDIDLALTATIIHNGSLEEAKSILAEEKNSFPWIDKSSMPQFFQRLLSTNNASESEALTMAILNFYKILERQVFPMKHHITISTCSNLIRRGRTKNALRLIRAVNRSKFGGTTPFDSVGVLMIAKASSIVGNLAGVRWAILTALNRDSAVSKDFVAEIYQTIDRFKSRSPEPLGSNSDAYSREIKYLEDLAEVLGQKEKFISRLSPGSTIPVDQKPQVHGDGGPKFTVPEIIDTNGISLSHTLSTWLERVQLEHALTSTNTYY